MIVSVNILPGSAAGHSDQVVFARAVRLSAIDEFEIERMRRFGEARSFAQGEAIFTAGQVGPGLVVILSGEVDIVRHEFSRESLIVMDGPGQFMGELAQLAGRPALVDAVATKPVQALIIAPERLRALLIAEAELGERIMRALILRRVGLLETGAGGPTIVGRADNVDVLRLQGFLRHNGHPHQLLNPETDDEAKALIEREVLDASEIKLLVDGQNLPPIKPLPAKTDDVQQVIKPERAPAKGGERPATA